VTLVTPLFQNFFRDRVGTFSGSMGAKLEVRIFRHFWAISI